MNTNKFFVAGFTVKLYDLRDGSTHDSFHAKLIPDLTADSFIHVTSEITKQARTLGFEVCDITRKECFPFSLTELYDSFDPANFDEPEEDQEDATIGIFKTQADEIINLAISYGRSQYEHGFEASCSGFASCELSAKQENCIKALSGLKDYLKFLVVES